MKEDIIKMIIIGIERGNNIKTMTERSSNEMITALEDLKKAYKLVSKPGSPDSLTFSRIALAFPHLACEYSAIALSRTVSTNALPDDFPGHITHSAFSNLIPVENTKVLDDLVQLLL